jgi:hypothetical protein
MSCQVLALATRRAHLVPAHQSRLFLRREVIRRISADSLAPFPCCPHDALLLRAENEKRGLRRMFARRESTIQGPPGSRPVTFRIVRPGDAQANAMCGYAPNVVITSRYTVANFVPKFLFEQFMRFVNVYFLCVARSFPAVSTAFPAHDCCCFTGTASFACFKPSLPSPLRRVSRLTQYPCP